MQQAELSAGGSVSIARFLCSPERLLELHEELVERLQSYSERSTAHLRLRHRCNVLSSALSVSAKPLVGKTGTGVTSVDTNGEAASACAPSAPRKRSLARWFATR